jgi:adenosine deaminase
MSVETYIRALPKVELNLQLEGAVPKETLLMLADQNEMGEQVKRFQKWVDLYNNPDFKKLDELTAMVRSWIQYADDITRVVYDVGVALSKDNVRYAEIAVSPLSFVSGDLTFDEFMAALNDGRDRAERAWGVKMRWVMAIPREETRQADEVARWASSTTARNGGVVAISLLGQQNPKTKIDQFERAFQTAEKKGLIGLAHLSRQDDVDEAIDLLSLNVISDAWGLTESPETLETMREANVALLVGMARARHFGWISDAGEYPLAELKNSGVLVLLNSEMPEIYETHLSEGYLEAHASELLTLEEIEAMCLDTLDRSQLDEADKAEMKAIFEMEQAALRTEHLATDEQESGR